MSENEEARVVYYIPDNFIEEGRIFQGRIRIRYLIEGLFLALFGLPFAFLIPVNGNMQLRVILLIVFCGPGLIAGLVGFNGDPLSVAVKAMWEWRKQKNAMLYNPKPIFVKTALIERNLEGDPVRDKFVGMVTGYQQKRVQEKMNASLVEGETFEFSEDTMLKEYTETDHEIIARLVEEQSDKSPELKLGNSNLDMDLFEADDDEYGIVETDVYGFTHTTSDDFGNLY